MTKGIEQRAFGAANGAGLARSGGAPNHPPALPGVFGARRAASAPKYGAENGAFGADEVIARLEEAGATLLALPSGGYSTKLRMQTLDYVRSAVEAYGYAGARMRPPVPEAARIDRMDEALCWLGLIPQDRYVLRRIVGARAMVNPLTGKHVFAWRKLGTMIGADHKAVQRWHAQGVDLIVAKLRG